MPQLVTKPNNRQLAFDEIRISVYADRVLSGLDKLDKDRLIRGVTSKLRRDEVTGMTSATRLRWLPLNWLVRKNRTGNLPLHVLCSLPCIKKLLLTDVTNPMRTSLTALFIR